MSKRQLNAQAAVIRRSKCRKISKNVRHTRVSDCINSNGASRPRFFWMMRPRIAQEMEREKMKLKAMVCKLLVHVHLFDLHYLDELFVVSDHDIDEHILQSASPLMDTGAWDILEDHLLTDLSFGDMLEKLQTYLGP